MSNNNVISNFNTPFYDERFGGVDLPFEVVSGTFDHWEIVSTTGYVYDPYVDTLVIDLQSDVVVKAYFGESRDVTFDVLPAGTATSININGSVINTFPYTTSILLGENIGLTPSIDPQYGFESWSSDSNVILPSLTTEVVSFDMAYGDNITLNLYQKPSIVYDVIPSGTTTSIEINGLNVNTFPYSTSVFIDDLNTLNPTIDPNYNFGFWSSSYNTFLNGSAMNNSFYGVYSDTITLNLISTSAFISGNDTICENAQDAAEISIAFNGVSPFTFVFSVNNEVQPSITTSVNPYTIKTKEAGVYNLVSYNDANEFGSISGQAMVTTKPSPIANFNAQPNSITTIFPTTQLVDKSLGNVVNWVWDFGDNSMNSYEQNPYHTYPDSIATYQISLIAHNSFGCADTAYSLINVVNEYWMYIPNSFSPDYDGINDKFCLNYNGVRESTFSLNIFDRFSNLVYSTNNIDDLSCENGWNGEHYETGQPLPMGLYVLQIYYQDFEGWKHEKVSSLTIIR